MNERTREEGEEKKEREQKRTSSHFRRDYCHSVSTLADVHETEKYGSYCVTSSLLLLLRSERCLCLEKRQLLPFVD